MVTFCAYVYAYYAIHLYVYIYICTYMMSAFLQVVLEAPLEMFLVGVLPCQKGRLDGMGLFMCRNILSWYICVICMIELIEPIV